jgi:hypothetical protein
MLSHNITVDDCIFRLQLARIFARFISYSKGRLSNAFLSSSSTSSEWQRFEILLFDVHEGHACLPCRSISMVSTAVANVSHHGQTQQDASSGPHGCFLTTLLSCQQPLPSPTQPTLAPTSLDIRLLMTVRSKTEQVTRFSFANRFLDKRAPFFRKHCYYTLGLEQVVYSSSENLGICNDLLGRR